MTYPQFLKALRKHRGTFEFVNHGRIRQKGTGCCPIEAVAGNGPRLSYSSGRKLKLSLAWVDVIMDAADIERPTLLATIKTRRDLLRAVGLKEGEVSGQTTTDFTRQWANRHDGECENPSARLVYDSTYSVCHCYRRWLEARLGEMLSSLPTQVELGIQIREICGVSLTTAEYAAGHIIFLLRKKLLPPKGAGDE